MIHATAGAKLFIGGTKPMPSEDLTASDFEGESWVEIKELESLGTVGDAAEEVEFAAIGQARTRRMKGTRSSAPMEIVCGIDYQDAGQLALIAAEKTSGNYAFKIEFPDAPAGGTPSERMFVAIVGSAAEAYDTANSVMRLNASLWVNSNIVRVNAAEGD